MSDDELVRRDQLKAAVLSELREASPAQDGQRGKLVHLVESDRAVDDVDELRSLPTLALTSLVESVRWTFNVTIPFARSVIEELAAANVVAVTMGRKLANPNPPPRKPKPASPPADAGSWDVSSEVAGFLEHVLLPNPVFHCVAAGEDDGESALAVKLTNKLRPPAAASALGVLREALKADADSFLALYSQYNGLSLYHGRSAVGLRFFPVKSWSRRTDEMTTRYWDMGYQWDEWPVGTRDALAFAQVPKSGNYFTVKTAGPERGAIYHCDLDFDDRPFSKSLDTFLARITTDPARFLWDAGCYTRYSDGKSDTQWIPKSFEAEPD